MSETQLVGRPLNGLLRAVFASPLYGASLGGGAQSPIAASFEDPWPGGAEAADRLFQGRYVFAGEEHRRAGAPPWGVADASPEWTAEINSFNWLRDFRAQGGETARRAARELLRAWLVRYPGWDAMAWRPDVLGRRLAAWLCHAGFLLDGADEGFRDAFLDHFARQARHLHRAARLGPEGAGRIAAAAGLCLAGAAFPGISAWRERGLAYLGAETERHLAHRDHRPTFHHQRLAIDSVHAGAGADTLGDRRNQCLDLRSHTLFLTVGSSSFYNGVR